MSKTLGQIAYDAAGEKLGSYPGIGEWQHVDKDGKAYWQAAANAVIEECAKVAEANWHSQKVLGNIYATGVLDAGNRIASSIRSLKTSTGETANE